MTDKPQGDKPEIRYVNLYEPEAKIYTRKISGFLPAAAPLLGNTAGRTLRFTALISIDGRPAVWLDMAHQKFHFYL